MPQIPPTWARSACHTYRYHKWTSVAMALHDDGRSTPHEPPTGLRDEGRVRLTYPVMLLIHDRQMRKHVCTCTHPLSPPPTPPSLTSAEIVTSLRNMKLHVCVIASGRVVLTSSSLHMHNNCGPTCTCTSLIKDDGIG